MDIKFGTDGWRAIIGKDFTKENVAAVVQAFSDLYPSLPEAGKPVVVGFDRRRQSKESAELVAKILTGNKIATILSTDYCPTPAVSWTVVQKNGAAGIMVTASHNPPNWNGIKFKESYGGAASGEYVAPIEVQIEKNQSQGRKPKLNDLQNNKYLTFFDAHADYLEALRSLVDFEAIKKSGIRIMADPLYGAGVGYFEDLLGSQVTCIHTAADPNFGGLHPEPILPYVQEAIDAIKNKEGYHACLITDGDADRIGAVDENGEYVTTHELYSLLLMHAFKNRNWKGKVLKSISTTVMIDRLCDKYGLEVDITPIGFKYISPAMKDPAVMIGGEESGGIGFKNHICERDGLFCSLMLMELMAKEKKTLSQLVKQIQQEVGPTFYRRIDLSVAKEKIDQVKEKLSSLKIESLAGKKMNKKTLIDGYHFKFEDDSWLLIRPSGTEPLLRTYAEASSKEQLEEMLSGAQKIIE